MLANSKGTEGVPGEIFYWIPDEMIIVVQLSQHPSADEQELLVEQVRRQLNELLAAYGLVLEPFGTRGRWRDAGQEHRLQGHSSFIFGLHKPQPLVAIFFHATHRDAAIVDPMPLALSYIQAQLDQLAHTGLCVVSAMPNWLVTAAPALYSDGGPAMLPQPAPTLNPAIADNMHGAWHTSCIDQHLPLDPDGAEGVLVAVLDTACHPAQLRAATADPQFRQNTLLRRLWTDLESGNGSFEIEYDRYPITDVACTGRDMACNPFYYPMPDHGMFVSGIVRDIAPQARIRLIRILNDYGSGDLYNLFAALTNLEKELISGTIQRLVINLSLTIMPDIRRLPSIWFNQRQWSSTQLTGVMRILGHIEEGLRLLFESFYAHGALVVAAAGNDSLLVHKEGKQPRPPRAPARYPTTLSVTSVNDRYVPSAFANAASIAPFHAGVATFGGDVVMPTHRSQLPDAVRGIYLSPVFPGGEQNISGWADWSGSSFAAPIISALGAHLMAQGWAASHIMTRLTVGKDGVADNCLGAPPDIPDLLASLVRVQQRYVVQ